MPVDSVSRRRAALAGGMGNVVEWYDWSIYAIFAVYFGPQFFTKGDPVVALIQTFAVFAVGFIARPVGAVTLGRLTDRLGRGLTMTVTVLIMAATSLVIAVSPTAQSIGVYAAVILVAMRLIQGLALGAETGAVGAFLAESAGARGRGGLTAVYAASVIVGTLIGTVVGVLITIPLSDEQMNDFGWRIPFFIGAALGVVGFFVRKGTEETLHEEVPRISTPLRTLWSDYRVDSIRTVAIGAVLAVLYFTFVSGFPSIAIVLGADSTASYSAASVALLVSVPLIVWFGRLSDRVGRRPVLLVAYAASALFIAPVVALMWDPSSVWKVYLAQLLICIPMSAIQGATMVSLIERFPPELRGSGFGFLWAVSMAIFGGTGPLIAATLAAEGITYIMSFYTILIMGVSALFVWKMPETAHDARPWEANATSDTV